MMADGETAPASFIDPAALAEHLERALGAPKGSNRFKREKFADIEPRAVEWLVKHFLPASGVGILAGPSTVGKTFVILYVCLRVAMGKTVLEHRSRKAGVLYVAAEGQNGVRKRIKALRDKFKIETAAFQFVGMAPDLLDADDMKSLTASALEAQEEMQAGAGVDLGMIIIDTTAASMPGGNENAGEDMSKALKHAQDMSAATGALVLLIGHTGKNEDLGVRGWSGQIGNSDVIIYLTADKEDPSLRLGVVHKLKDGEGGERFAYRLKSIHMGVDGDGDAITSAYPVFEAPPADAVKGKRAPVLKPNSKLILRALLQMIDDGRGEPAPALAGVKTGTKAIRRQHLRLVAVRMGYAEGSENADSARRSFNREITKLVASGHVRVDDELVWPIK